MPEDVVIAGNRWNDVPFLTLDKAGGGTANFYHDLQAIALRQNAEKVKTWTYDKKIYADEGISVPAYTTTATTLKASEALSNDTYTMDNANYNYFLVQRSLSIPIYSVTTKAKGRVEYHASSYLYDINDIPPSTIQAILNTTKYTDRIVGYSGQSTNRLVYWSTSSALSAYSTTAYGVIAVSQAPTISNGVITISTPNLNIRGHTTYYTSTYMNATTDIRYQWIAELWRSPKNTLGVDGWASTQNILKVFDCAKSSTHKLI